MCLQEKPLANGRAVKLKPLTLLYGVRISVCER